MTTRRKVAGSKVANLKSRLGEQEIAGRHTELLDEICKSLKKKDYETLLSVRAFLRGEAEGDTKDRFPRGVTVMGGNQTRSVPRYAVMVCLQRVTGMEISVLEQVDPDCLRNVFLFGGMLTASTHMPEKRMVKEDFYKWYVAKYKDAGNLLCNFQLSADYEVDWHTSVGHYCFAKSVQCGEGVYDVIKERVSGKFIPVPLGMKVPATAAGVEWQILNNWVKEEAELCYVAEGSIWKLHQKFLAVENKVPMSPGRACRPVVRNTAAAGGGKRGGGMLEAGGEPPAKRAAAGNRAADSSPKQDLDKARASGEPSSGKEAGSRGQAAAEEARGGGEALAGEVPPATSEDAPEEEEEGEGEAGLTPPEGSGGADEDVVVLPP